MHAQTHTETDTHTMAAQHVMRTYLHIIHMHHSTAGIHILLQIPLDKLENECERVVCVNDIVKRDNVCMFEVFEQRDFSNGRAGSSLFMLQSYLFQSY